MRGHKPQIRQHVRGQYFVEWGGRKHWLGTDKSQAEMTFYDPAGEHPGAHVNWAAWRTARERQQQSRRRAGGSVFAEVVAAYLASLPGKRSDWTIRHAKNHLRRATNILGRFRVDELTGELLDAFQTDLMQLGLAKSTVRHDIEQVRACIRWGCRAGLCPAELLLQVDILERIRVPRTMPKYISREHIAEQCAIAERTQPIAAACLRLCYLAAVRPSESVAIAQGQGVFAEMPPMKGFMPHDRWLLTLSEHKTSRSTGEARYIVMSGAALAVFDELTRLREAGERMRDLWDFSRRLRDSGATLRGKAAQKAASTHLEIEGVEAEVVRQALGRTPPGADWTYRQRAWPALLDAMARLSL
ncbi:MAG: hypothetical protein AAGF47_06060 [Planctomycetota bacterium]